MTPGILVSCGSTPDMSSFGGAESLTALAPEDNKGVKTFEDIQKKRAELQKTDGDKKDASGSAPEANKQDIPKPQSTGGPLPTYGSFFDRTFGKVIYANFTLQKNANEDFPVLVDVAIVYNDAATYTALRGVTNGAWFNYNNESIQNIKRTPNVEVHSFEFPPEERSMRYLIEVRSGAVGALLFNRMNGFAPDYAVIIDPYANLHFAAQGGQFGVYSGD